MLTQRTLIKLYARKHRKRCDFFGCRSSVSVLLGYDTASLGKWSPAFRQNTVASCLRVEMSKTAAISSWQTGNHSKEMWSYFIHSDHIPSALHKVGLLCCPFIWRHSLIREKQGSQNTRPACSRLSYAAPQLILFYLQNAARPKDEMC